MSSALVIIIALVNTAMMVVNIRTLVVNRRTLTSLERELRIQIISQLKARGWARPPF